MSISGANHDNMMYTSIRYAKNQQTFKPHTNRIQLLFNLLTSVSHNFSLTRIHNVTRQSRSIQKKNIEKSMKNFY